MTTKLISIIAVAIIAAAITSMPIPFYTYGQIITFEEIPQEIASSTLSLNISFTNNTNSTLTEESITEEQGNIIISAINAILQNDEETLEDLELLPMIEESEEIEEDEEIEEEDSDSNGDDNDNNNDDNNNDKNDNDNNDDNNGNNDNNNGGEPGPIPGPGPPIDEDEEDDNNGDDDDDDNDNNGDEEDNNNNEEIELEQRITGKGCGGDASKVGYYIDDPNPKCYPIVDGKPDTTPPEGYAFCAALGCPYNPPDL